MNAQEFRSQDTTNTLHDATRAGVPMLIPGAREPGPGRVTQVQASDAVAAHTVPAADNDRGLLEHQREGGGAPCERSGLGMLARMWRRVMTTR